MAQTTSDYPVILFSDQNAWLEWLERHHDSERGIRLRIAKKKSTLSSVSYDEAVEAALCYGWIDGQSKGYDEHSWIQRFTPRTRRSNWSRLNRERAEALIRAGRMRPAGLAAIEAARADGRWERALE